jgi:hypothetical protein
MPPAQHQDEALFRAAIQLAHGPVREAFLELACRGNASLHQRIAALIAAQEKQNSLAESDVTVQASTVLVPSMPDEGPGAVIGRYKLLEKIGEGGMGSVYMAEQEEPVSSDRTAKVWDASSGQQLRTLRGHSDAIYAVAFSPNGRRIATGSFDETAKVWDADSGRELLTLRGHTDWIWSLAFSPDGRRIVTGCRDHTAKVWDTESGTNLLTIKGPEMISSVAFSPDGRRIVTGCSDHTARVWDTESGTNLLTLRGHSDQVWSVAYSADGQRIVTGCRDNTAKVWGAATGEELLTLKEHSSSVHCVAFSPDGRRIVTGSWDQTAKVWAAATAQQVAAWQEEERMAAQSFATEQREWPAEQERQRIARARDEGAIKRWLILSPIMLATNQTGPQGLDIQQVEGEGQLRPKAGDATSIDGRELKWRAVTSESDDYVIDFNAVVAQLTEHSVAYAVCYIRAESEQHGLQMLVGSDDEAKVYLNGKGALQNCHPAPLGCRPGFGGRRQSERRAEPAGVQGRE